MTSSHGTYRAWLNGCTCDGCFRAARAVHKAREATTKPYRGGAPKKIPRTDLAGRTHGKRGTYQAGCRCAACAAVERAYQRRHQASLRDVS